MKWSHFQIARLPAPPTAFGSCSEPESEHRQSRSFGQPCLKKPESLQIGQESPGHQLRGTWLAKGAVGCSLWRQALA